MHGSLPGVLREIVGDAHVLDDPSVTEKYRVDWTGRFRAEAAVVVRPGTTGEVAEVVRTCREQGAAVVPQGGNTGLVGGSVPLDGEVVVSLERMHAVESVNATAGTLVAQAGATLASVQQAAHSAGWVYGVDIAAPSPHVDIVALEDALTELAALDARSSQVVELRFFGGFTVEETAEALGVSVRTVKRDWNTARAWLYRALSRPNGVAHEH